MSSDRIKIRVRSGQNEAEIEAEAGRIREAIDLIPEVASRLPEGRADVRRVIAPNEPTSAPPPADVRPQSELPSLSIEKGDSLSDVITKFFADPWGRSPRKLSEVRDALQSYGLSYPKQSVAVALLRLAKSSKVRRFKSAGGEYVYTASTAMIPSQVLILPETEEPQPEIQTSANL